MKRSNRAQLAAETVAIVERGDYSSPGGAVVSLAPLVAQCLSATRYYTPEALHDLRDAELAKSGEGEPAQIEVVNETTLVGIGRLLQAGAGSVAALNFASAKNPGGGFLGGSQAQEESLARSSALYASLMKAWDYYERHRRGDSAPYSDAMILSPACPVFRDDDGRLLDAPQLATFITSAAPNAGAAAANHPDELPLIPAVFLRRSEYVLALAAAHGHRQLVLGAWGCGVFRNDPQIVAEAFAAHLRRPMVAPLRARHLLRARYVGRPSDVHGLPNRARLRELGAMSLEPRAASQEPQALSSEL
ncbi:MAG: TIGR02452 family protein [Pirellulales bacterium]